MTNFDVTKTHRKQVLCDLSFIRVDSSQTNVQTRLLKSQNDLVDCEL